MADSAIAVTAGTGTNIDTRTEGTNSNHRQVVVLGDPATNAGVAPVDATAGLKVDLGADNDVTVTSGSITANAGTNLNTSTLALETGGNLAGAATSLAVIDDWDETDRAKVNIIVGQAGITAGSGAIAANTPRVALATDSPGVVATAAHDAVDTGDPIKIGGYAKAAAPTDASADGDRVNAWFLRNGAQATVLTAAGALIGGDAANGLYVNVTRSVPGTGATALGKAIDTAVGGTDTGVGALVKRVDSLATLTPADGDWVAQQVDSKGRTYVEAKPKLISAAFTTLTRPANTTGYTANDSISDNATAGSVTALSATVSDINDEPVVLSAIEVDSTDTGLGGKYLRAYLYNANPTSSSGVGAGDNAAFSNKKAGFIGTMSGLMRTFSDGSRGRLTPDEGVHIITTPTSGAKTLYIQYQTLSDFTPSANSTTLIGTAKGFQGHV